VNKRLRTLLLVALLLVVGLALSGCMGQPTEPINLDQPVGLWNTIVYALAKVLIALNDFIANLGIPYSWGWAIIVFTIAIKVVTLPLTFKQLQSAKAQQMMQPKLRELQEKYGKDKQKLSEEQMKLYKEAGINPLGGCLPLLIQLPILWALYQALFVLAGSGHLKNAPFFWIPDLSLPGSTAATAGTVDGVLMLGTSWISTAFKEQNWYVLFAYMSLPVFMLLTQMLLQKMSQPAKDPKTGKADPQTQMMGQMMFLMPVMFFWITLGLPAGLTLYWSVSNVLGMVQQYFVTGWGSLPDWFRFLPKPQPATAGVMSASSSMPTPTPVPTTTDPVEKPVKRRKRRK
jgi:YidC/Oxa1 family membrane protein insertase